MAKKTGNINPITECEKPDCLCILDNSGVDSGDTYTTELLQLFENCPDTGKDLHLCPECFMEKIQEAGEMSVSETNEEFDFYNFVNSH